MGRRRRNLPRDHVLTQQAEETEIEGKHRGMILIVMTLRHEVWANGSLYVSCFKLEVGGSLWTPEDVHPKLPALQSQ